MVSLRAEFAVVRVRTARIVIGIYFIVCPFCWYNLQYILALRFHAQVCSCQFTLKRFGTLVSCIFSTSLFSYQPNFRWNGTPWVGLSYIFLVAFLLGGMGHLKLCWFYYSKLLDGVCFPPFILWALHRSCCWLSVFWDQTSCVDLWVVLLVYIHFRICNAWCIIFFWR